MLDYSSLSVVSAMVNSLLAPDKRSLLSIVGLPICPVSLGSWLTSFGLCLA